MVITNVSNKVIRCIHDSYPVCSLCSDKYLGQGQEGFVLRKGVRSLFLFEVYDLPYDQFENRTQGFG